MYIYNTKTIQTTSEMICPFMNIPSFNPNQTMVLRIQKKHSKSISKFSTLNYPKKEGKL